MFTIGDISKVVNISANTLRYYDEIGLLKPYLVQASNQYRYYSNSQIKELTYILELKQYGFSLDEIKILLQDNSNLRLKSMLEKRRVELRNEINSLEEQYVLLEKRISKISREDELKMKEGTVLIVDDFELARKIIRNIVEEYGYTVVGEASTGEEGIAAYDTLKPDLVIMDIVMPKMDGIDAAVQILKKYENARIIMCSAMNKAKVLLKSLKIGVRDFVSKPISSIRLIEALERSLDNNYSFNKDEVVSTNDYEYPMNGPLSIDLKTLTYFKDKFSELSHEFSCDLTNKFNSECTIKLITVENITLSELKTLWISESDIGTIKHNTSLPIHVHLSDGFVNKKEIIRAFLDLTAKNFKRIFQGFNGDNLIISLDSQNTLNENYSIILISFSIEFMSKDKGFIMLSLPHDFLKYLQK